LAYNCIFYIIKPNLLIQSIILSGKFLERNQIILTRGIPGNGIGDFDALFTGGS